MLATRPAENVPNIVAPIPGSALSSSLAVTCEYARLIIKAKLGRTCREKITPSSTGADFLISIVGIWGIFPRQAQSYRGSSGSLCPSQACKSRTAIRPTIRLGTEERLVRIVHAADGSDVQVRAREGVCEGALCCTVMKWCLRKLVFERRQALLSFLGQGAWLFRGQREFRSPFLIHARRVRRLRRLRRPAAACLPPSGRRITGGPDAVALRVCTLLPFLTTIPSSYRKYLSARSWAGKRDIFIDKSKVLACM